MGIVFSIIGGIAAVLLASEAAKLIIVGEQSIMTWVVVSFLFLLPYGLILGRKANQKKEKPL